MPIPRKPPLIEPEIDTGARAPFAGLADGALVLGIETSCDETAAAVVAADGTILSNLVLSQVDQHRPYGGVVPEIAARAHVDHLDSLIARAVTEAGIDFSQLAAVAATSGPGLIGGVMVGLVTGKAIAAARNVPFVAVNHLEAHALTIRLTDHVAFPYLLLLVSGGHCQVLSVLGVGNYRRLGDTAQDAGYAFLAPPPSLCTDNAVMVAWAGVERLRLGMVDGLETPPRARWPLDPTAPPVTGAGVKA